MIRVDATPCRTHLLGMVVELLLPILAIILMTVLITRVVEALMPETIAGILVTALVAALLVWGAAALGFAGLYLLESPRFAALLGDAPGASAQFFLNLGAKAGLIWGPILALVIVTAPRRWTTNTW